MAPVDDTSATWTKPGSDADDNCRARIDQYRTMLNDTPRCRANSLIDWRLRTKSFASAMPSTTDV